MKSFKFVFPQNKCIGDDTKAAARQSPNCIKKTKKNMAKNDFQYGGWNSYTLQCGTIMTLISPGDCTLLCGMWLWNRVALGLPCNVKRGSGMTCHWIRQVAEPCNMAPSSGIMTVNSPIGSTLQCDAWFWHDMTVNSPGGSTLQCDTQLRDHDI